MAPFKPFADRSTSVVLVKLKSSDQYYLVSSLSTRSDTQIINIDPTSGALSYSHEQDNYQDEIQAFDALHKRDQIEIIDRGYALLGYVPVGMHGLILLASRVRGAVTLPGGHSVKLITDSKWHLIPLKGNASAEATRLNTDENNNLQLLLKYSLNNAHYYCETADISRPFPSTRSVDDPSWQFVWNRWLGAALRNAGLGAHCPAVLQGVVEAKSATDANNQGMVIALFARRSRLHPGMRYIARGLNHNASPGNEIECEQLVWTMSTQEVKWSGYVWRRGTVPIWWGVEVRQGGVGEADVVIPQYRPYRGVARYFRRLQKRYMPNLQIAAALKAAQAANGAGPQAEQLQQDFGPEGQSAADRALPIVCVNLLRCSMTKRNELLLSEHFAEGIRHLRRKLPGAPIHLTNFDWHGNIKDLKDKGTVEGLWAQLQQVMQDMDLHTGTWQAGQPESADACCTPWPGGSIRWLSQQQGIVRYNCADSLDRTNAASYFGAVQALAEQCRRLGLLVEMKSGARHRPWVGVKGTGSLAENGQDLGAGNGNSEAMQRGTKGPGPLRYPGTTSGSGPPLPVGWEARVDEATGRTFYMDHNTKRTTWTRPTTPTPSCTGSPQGTPGQTAAQQSPAALRSNGQGSAANGSGESCAWGLFGCSVDQVKARLLPDLVAEHAEIFMINGDMQSNLYTASRAMHSHILNLLQESSGSGAAVRTSVGKLANLQVAVQRRWSNMMTDAIRQQVLEMFLGLKWETYFPSVKVPYVSDLPLEGESDHESDGDDSEATRAQQLRFGTELKSKAMTNSASSRVKGAPQADMDGHLVATGASACLSVLQLGPRGVAEAVAEEEEEDVIAAMAEGSGTAGAAAAPAEDLLLPLNDKEADSVVQQVPQQLQAQLLHEEKDVFSGAQGHGNSDIFGFLVGENSSGALPETATAKAAPLHAATTTAAAAAGPPAATAFDLLSWDSPKRLQASEPSVQVAANGHSGKQEQDGLGSFNPFDVPLASLQPGEECLTETITPSAQPSSIATALPVASTSKGNPFDMEQDPFATLTDARQPPDQGSLL